MNKEAFLLLAKAGVLLVPFGIQGVQLLFDLFRHAARSGARKRKTRALQADVADYQVLAAVYFHRERLRETDAVEFSADLTAFVEPLR